MSTGSDVERLRQSAIGTLLGIPRERATTELLKAQVRQINREPALKQRLEIIKKYKTPDEINKLRAETFQARQSGILSQQRATEISRLLDEKEEAERLGNQLKLDEINSQLTVLFPAAGGGTESALVPATDIARYMKDIEVAGMRGGGGDLAERKFAVQEEQTAVDIDKIIRESPKSAEALARYQDFNRYSNRPRVAINDNGKIRFINLPKVGGKIITGRQIYEAAKEMNLSVEEYLTEVLKVPDAIKYLK